MKEETLEEEYLNQLIDEANKEFTLDRKLAKDVAIKYAKWQQERMYSEEQILVLLHKRDKHNMDNPYTFSGWETPKEFIEQFKKK